MRGELLVVVTQFSEHIHRRDEICIVIRDALLTGDLTN